MKKEEKQRAESILLGFALKTYQSGGKARIHLRFGKIGLLLLAFVAIGWFSTATALYFYFKMGFQLDRAGIGIREHGTDLSWEGVKFTGMLALPFRLDEHRRELGDYYILRAEESVKDQEYKQALDLLRIGVGKSPGNLRGRRLLSEFFDFSFKQPDDAANLLIGGIKHGGSNDSAYLGHVFRFLLVHEYDGLVIETGDKLLRDWKGDEKDKPLVALALATAYFHQYKFGKAHELISEHSLGDYEEGNVLLAEMHWKRGEKEEALALLKETTRKFPFSTQVYSKTSQFLKESGDTKRALRTIVMAQVNNPDSLELAVEVLRMLHAGGHMDRFQETFDDVLEGFAKDLKSSIGLANAMAGLGMATNCQRVNVKAEKLGYADPRLELAVLTSKILAGRAEEAILEAGDLAKESEKWKVGHYKNQLSFLLALATFANGDKDKGNALLRDFMEAGEKAPPPSKIHEFAKYLIKLGYQEQARETLEYGRIRYTSFRPVLEDLVRQDLAAGHHPGLPDSIGNLLQASRKDAALLLKCRERLASDFYMFVPNQGDLLDSLANSLRKIKNQGALPEGVEI